jgi:hypothetical protein
MSRDGTCGRGRRRSGSPATRPSAAHQAENATADETRDRRWREPGFLERDDERPALGDAHRAERRVGAATRSEGGEPLADHAIPVERLG